MALRTAGTITAWRLLFTKADGTTQIADVGIGAAGPSLPVYFDPPINGFVNDNVIITITATGATGGSLGVTVTYKLVAA